MANLVDEDDVGLETTQDEVVHRSQVCGDGVPDFAQGHLRGIG
jgi:hypothetical protein